jgi:hypothetical protein
MNCAPTRAGLPSKLPTQVKTQGCRWGVGRLRLAWLREKRKAGPSLRSRGRAKATPLRIRGRQPSDSWITIPPKFFAGCP